MWFNFIHYACITVELHGGGPGDNCTFEEWLHQAEKCLVDLLWIHKTPNPDFYLFIYFLIWRWTVLQKKMPKSVKTVWIQTARTSKFYVVRMMCDDQTEGQALKGWSLEVLLACKLKSYTTTASVDVLSKKTRRWYCRFKTNWTAVPSGQ